MAADAKKKQIQTAEEKKPSGQRKAASAKRTQQAAEKKSGERKNTAKKETSAKPVSGRADAKKRAASKRTSDKPVNIKLTEKELLDFPILDEVLIWVSLAVCVICLLYTSNHRVYGFNSICSFSLLNFRKNVEI